MSDEVLRAYAQRVRRAGHDPVTMAAELLRESDGYVEHSTVELLMRQLAPWLVHVAGPVTLDGPQSPLCGYVPAEGTGMTTGGPATATCLLCLRHEAATLAALENRLTSLGMGHLVSGTIRVGTPRMWFLDTGENRCAEFVWREGSLYSDQCGHLDGHDGPHARALGQCWASRPHGQTILMMAVIQNRVLDHRCARLAVRYANGHAMCDEHARAWEQRQADMAALRDAQP